MIFLISSNIYCEHYTFHTIDFMLRGPICDVISFGIILFTTQGSEAIVMNTIGDRQEDQVCNVLCFMMP